PRRYASNCRHPHPNRHSSPTRRSSDLKVTDKYRADIQLGTPAPLPENLAPMAEGIHLLIQAVYDERALKDMIVDGHETKVKENPDRKSTRLNSSHVSISYAVFCLKKTK